MSKGLDIKIENCTKGYHFDIISDHTKTDGCLDWELLLYGGNQVVHRMVFTRKIGVTFTWCPYEKILIAFCWEK